MSEEKPKETKISRASVQKLVDNLKASADEVEEMLAAEEIEIEPLLEATRYMARTARRIARRANWQFSTPAPGNERTEEAPKKDARRGGDDRKPRRSSGGAPRRDGDRGRRPSARGGNRS